MTTRNVEKVEQAVFYCMSGFALCTCISIAAGNFFLGFGILFFLYRLYLKHDDIFPLPLEKNFMRFVGAFLLIALLSAIASGEVIAGVKRFMDYYFYRMMPMVIVLLIIKDKKKLLQLAGCIWLSLILDSSMAVWQGMHGDFRAAGFNGHPMFLAGILSMLIPIFASLVVQIKNTSPLKKPLIGSLCILLAALLLNGTRGAWLALVITVPIVTYFACENLKKYFSILLVVTVITLTLFMTISPLQQRLNTLEDPNYQSNSERILIWTSAWHMFKDYPILGVGLGRYTAEYQTKYISPEAKEMVGHAHNNFLQMLAETGALGFITFTTMILYFFYYGYQGWRREKNIAYLAFFGMTLGLILQGLTEYNFGDSMVIKLYWLMTALCIQIINFEKKEV